ncbi:transcriptional regulator, HxlR family [Filimonas lacunae]|uniref:Transcriptional regulator, HxlR family n=1 Tax=Filimonas lacunae TaxID=477680 RepID=A0A173MIH0_9BACT|nr:helix-turn-helix domain-containing protein [Filimonas lacunae]BAV07432.1 transcriptional regulator, HxlR family [Filimonas lacunae]SIT30393.1 transcriptional regulator, HxlR family [Filimonas lacunae]
MAQRKLTSTNTMNRDFLNNTCGMMYAIDMLNGRWALLILYKLENRTLRFSELKKRVPKITDRMLTLQLQELEKNGLVIRSVYAEVPPRVEYHLSESALNLIPIWKQLEKWGDAHKGTMENAMQSAV